MIAPSVRRSFCSDAMVRAYPATYPTAYLSGDLPTYPGRLVWLGKAVV